MRDARFWAEILFSHNHQDPISESLHPQLPSFGFLCPYWYGCFHTSCASKKRGRARWWGGGCGIKFQCWTASELNDAVLQLTFSCNHEGRGQNQRNGIRPMGLAKEMTDLGPIDGCQGIFASASACRRREYIEILYREYNNS